MKRLTLKIPDQLHEKLRWLAISGGQTLGGHVYVTLENHVTARKAEVEGVKALYADPSARLAAPDRGSADRL